MASMYRYEGEFPNETIVEIPSSRAGQGVLRGSVAGAVGAMGWPGIALRQFLKKRRGIFYSG